MAKTDAGWGGLRNTHFTESINFLHSLVLTYQLKLNLIQIWERRGISSPIKSVCRYPVIPGEGEGCHCLLDRNINLHSSSRALDTAIKFPTQDNAIRPTQDTPKPNGKTAQPNMLSPQLLN